MNIILCITITIVLLIIYILSTHRFDHFAITNAKPLISSVDGRLYKVHPQHTHSDRAANILAKLNEKIVDLLKWLKNKHKNDKITQRLLERYNPDNLIENSPKDPSNDTAYSLNKGSKIAICLREKSINEDELLSMSILLFVTFHEMAHIGIDAINHPPEFWSAFKYLLYEASVANIYHSPNFANSAVEYCGIKVDYNPLFDTSVKQYTPT